MIMEQLEFKSDLLDIDPNELDKECLIQPKRYYHYAKMLEKARKRQEHLKAAFKLIIAKCGDDIRKDAQQKKQKLTEASITNTLILRKDYQQAEKDVIEATYQAGVLEAAVKSLYQKKDCIEYLIRLHGQNYYSKVKTDNDNKDRMTDLRMKQMAKRNVRK
jgi:hypothetical protein